MWRYLGNSPKRPFHYRINRISIRNVNGHTRAVLSTVIAHASTHATASTTSHQNSPAYTRVYINLQPWTCISITCIYSKSFALALVHLNDNKKKNKHHRHCATLSAKKTLHSSTVLYSRRVWLLGERSHLYFTNRARCFQIFTLMNAGVRRKKTVARRPRSRAVPT